MMKIFYFVPLVLLSFQVNGQFILPIIDDSIAPKHEFIFIGLADYSSSSILNQLSDMLLYGGEISDEIKTASFDKHGPINHFGLDLHVGKTINVDLYEPELNVFDPLSITKDNYIWHRGYPIEFLQKRHRVEYKGKTERKVLVQADLWDGDPDIDAMARLTYKPIVKYSDITEPYCSNAIAPFNSQNTFLAREVIPFYSVLPFTGRMDDIWGGYILQHYFPNSVIYAPASVYQDRNVQDLVTNLEKEIIGYRNTLQLVENLVNFEEIIPKEALEFYNKYKKSFI